MCSVGETPYSVAARDIVVAKFYRYVCVVCSSRQFMLGPKCRFYIEMGKR